MENFILTMENWGTYRQTDGPLQVYNYQERQIETLASFGLDDIPRADALLLFDSHFRAAGYAAEIVMRHEQKYGNKPEFLTCGGRSNKEASANDGKTQAEWYEHMFLSWGFDEEWVLKNHINSQSTSNRMNIREIRRMLICSPVLNKIRRPDILVVTGCGYTLRAAQELGFAFPDCRLHFYETPVTPVDKRYFDYEAFNGNGIGWGIDTVLATMLHCMRFWGTERLALPPEKAKKGQYDQANAFERLRALLSLPRHVGISGRQFPTGTGALPSTPFGTVRHRRHGISAAKRNASVY